MEESRRAEVVSASYEAASGAASWGDAGDAFRLLVGARTASLSVWTPAERGVRVLCTANVPDADWAARAYVDRYHTSDVWSMEGIRLAARLGASPRAWLGEEVVPEEGYRRSEFYCDFGRRIGVRRIIGAPAALGGGAFAMLGLHRPEDAKAFRRSDVEAVTAALPHIRRALILHRRLEAEASASGAAAGALDAFGTAALVVDAEMRVVFANAAAERLAAAGDGLRIAASRLSGARPVMQTSHRADAARLAALVRAVSLRGEPGGGMRLRRPPAADGEGTPLPTMVSPLPSRLSGRSQPGAVARGLALVLVADPARRPVPPPGLLADLLGLTATEAVVAAGLAAGATAEAVAAERRVSAATVRGHVRAILGKTGAANLRDLQRVVASLPGAETPRTRRGAPDRAL